MSQRQMSAHDRVAHASLAALQLALDALHDTELQQALMHRMHQEADAFAVAEARDRIRQALVERREDFLIQILRATTDATLRNDAAKALADLRSAAGLAAIIDLLDHPATRHARSSLLRALNRAHVALNVNILVKLIVHETEEAQYEALLALEAGRYTHDGKAHLRRCADILQKARDETDRRTYVDDALKVVANACVACQTDTARRCKRCR